MDSSSLKKGGSKICKVHEVLDAPILSLDPSRPAYREWNMVGIIIGLSLAPWERHPVITGGDNQGIGQLTRLLKMSQDSSEVRIVVLNLNRIIEHVSTRSSIIRPECRDVIDVFQSLSHPETNTILIGTVRFARAVPETPGVPLWGTGKEVRKVPGIVII